MAFILLVSHEEGENGKDVGRSGAFIRKRKLSYKSSAKFYFEVRVILLRITLLSNSTKNNLVWIKGDWETDVLSGHSAIKNKIRGLWARRKEKNGDQVDSRVCCHTHIPGKSAVFAC